MAKGTHSNARIVTANEGTPVCAGKCQSGGEGGRKERGEEEEKVGWKCAAGVFTGRCPGPERNVQFAFQRPGS